MATLAHRWWVCTALPKDSAWLYHRLSFPPFFSFYRILATSSADKGLGRLRKCSILGEEIECQEIPLRGTVLLPPPSACFAVGRRGCRGFGFRREPGMLLGPTDQQTHGPSHWEWCLEAARPLLPQLKSSPKLCWNTKFLFPVYSLVLWLLITDSSF